MPQQHRSAAAFAVRASGFVHASEQPDNTPPDLDRQVLRFRIAAAAANSAPLEILAANIAELLGARHG